MYAHGLVLLTPQIVKKNVFDAAIPQAQLQVGKIASPDAPRAMGQIRIGLLGGHDGNMDPVKSTPRRVGRNPPHAPETLGNSVVGKTLAGMSPITL